MPCPGHHPPTSSDGLMGTDSCDDDRFSFSFRVSHWERAQLKGFIKSIDRMVAAKAATPDSMTSTTSAVEDNRLLRFCRALLSSERPPDPHEETSDSVSALTQALHSVSKSERGLKRSRSFTEGMPSFGLSGCRSAQKYAQSFERDLRALLKECPVDISIYNRTWDGVLLRAAASGNADLMNFAITNGANVNGKDANGLSSLKLATIGGAQQATELLLREGANPALARPECKELLNVAIDTGDHQLLELLLAAGSQPVHWLQRAVMKAGERGDLRSLSILCAHENRLGGEDLQKFQKAVLTHASYGAIQWLVDSGLQTTSQKTSILLSACQNGREDLVRLLRQRGVQVEDAAFESIEEHPLYKAARLQNEECLRLMLTCCTDMKDPRKREVLGQASLDMLAQKRPKSTGSDKACSSATSPHHEIWQWALKL